MDVMNMCEESSEFCFKVHPSADYRMIGICDRDIIGKEFREEEGDGYVFVDPWFFDGGYADRKRMMALLSTADSVNIIGNSAVDTAIEGGYVDPDRVLIIEGVKTAIIMSL